jgi:hypothetical protein
LTAARSWEPPLKRGFFFLALVASLAPGAQGAEPNSPFRSFGEENSYAIPALEIVLFDTILNRVNNQHYGCCDYRVTMDSVRRNLQSSWVTDRDPFAVNQLGHPYQGSMYHTFARSAGLGYWEGLAYTFLGSAMWEVAGETTPPSRNDQITTGIGGSFLGESLFRMASLILEKEGLHSGYREFFGALVSPATGFNRHAFGDRFKPVFPLNDGAHFTRLQIGFSGTPPNDDEGVSTTKLKRNEALADYYLEYGLPGKPGYSYDRPFDYFAFQATLSSANGFENVMTRGLLKGRAYQEGENVRGVFGLYGSYDYIFPQTFRVASTAASLGSTVQWHMSEKFVLLGTGLLGAGYTAVGSAPSTTDGDYHYGLAPQALAAARLVYKDRLALDVTAREYFVSKVGGARGGHENIARVDAALTWRVLGQHGISIKYLGNFRDAFHPDTGDTSQHRATIGLFYTLLGNERFGAVNWK